MILISKTYEIVTPESAENGDVEDHGFVTENEPVTFRELVDLMQQFPEPSCSPASGDYDEWLSDYGDTDYRTGEHRRESLHYSRQNPGKNDKYWRWAMQAAGIIKAKEVA
jgi:hypothetical protein